MTDLRSIFWTFGIHDRRSVRDLTFGLVFMGTLSRRVYGSDHNQWPEFGAAIFVNS